MWHHEAPNSTSLTPHNNAPTTGGRHSYARMVPTGLHVRCTKYEKTSKIFSICCMNRMPNVNVPAAIVTVEHLTVLIHLLLPCQHKSGQYWSIYCWLVNIDQDSIDPSTAANIDQNVLNVTIHLQGSRQCASFMCEAKLHDLFVVIQMLGLLWVTLCHTVRFIHNYSLARITILPQVMITVIYLPNDCMIHQ